MYGGEIKAKRPDFGLNEGVVIRRLLNILTIALGGPVCAARSLARCGPCSALLLRGPCVHREHNLRR